MVLRQATNKKWKAKFLFFFISGHFKCKSLHFYYKLLYVSCSVLLVFQQYDKVMSMRIKSSIRSRKWCMTCSGNNVLHKLIFTLINTGVI